MKSPALNIILAVLAILFLIYGYKKGWFSALTGNSSVPVTTTVPVVSNAQISNPNIVAVTDPSTVQVDHASEGFVLIPIDSSGNVVPPNKAVQFIKYSAMGQDCNIQYRDRIYFIQPRKFFHNRHIK